MKRSAACALALVFALTGCGPRSPLDIGVRHAPVDILYGAQHKPSVPARAPGANLFPGFPSFIVPPPPARTAPPVQPPVPCPSPPPTAFPALAATANIARAPEPGSYTFRRSGRYTENGFSRSLAPNVTRVVGAATKDTVSGVDHTIIGFSVTQDEGPARTTTTYVIDPGGADPGLKIAAIQTTGPEGTDSFTPAAPITIMTLPASPGGQSPSAGSDPVTGVSMVVLHRTDARIRIAACGALVDAWKVVVTGRILNSTHTKDLTLTAEYAVATQYGGLIVFDDVSLQGQDDVGAVDLKSTTTINAVPPEAAR